MRIPARIKINMIAFFVLAAALLFLMASQVLTILEARYSVYAIFSDAGGVFTNQEVTYRGITVGQVGSMEVVPQGVKLQLNIDEKYRIPKEDVEARVMFKSAVGEQFVDILPASAGEPFLQDGDTIPLEQTTIPVSTQELLTVLEAVLRGVPPEDLKGAVDALGIGLTGRGPDIATILESTADLAELFAERAPEVQGILREGSKVGRAFVASSDDFEIAIRELAVVAETLSENRANLERLMRSGNLASDEVVDLLRTYESQINTFLHRFAVVNELQAEHAGDLSQIFIHLPTALNRVVASFEPTTGLVRFGLVNDNNRHACSYGTERRKPSARGPRLPPKNAHCGRQADQQRSSAFSPLENLGASPPPGATDAAPELGPLPELDAGTPVLPARMSDWSWTLLYLNGV